MSSADLETDVAPDGSVALREWSGLSRDRRPPAARTPAAAFDSARRCFLAGERVDMRALAGELGISRPTLYRWTGPREQLLADILFALSDASFRHAIRATAQTAGPERLLAVFRHHVTAIVSSHPLQTFIRNETPVALRILTSRHSTVHTRTISRLAELYRVEQARSHFTLPTDVDTLAFAVVCLTESFIYDDQRAAVEPAVEQAAAVVALLLGADITRTTPNSTDPLAPLGPVRSQSG